MDQIQTTTAVAFPKREAPWIGIGVSGAWDDYRDALAAAQLDFTVWQEKVYWDKPVVPIKDIPGYPYNLISQHPEELDLMVNVRDTDNKVLGTVTRQYGVVQNKDAFSLLQPFTEAGGIITNAGMTEQGLCFMVLRMRNARFLGDDYDFDVMCTNSFNTAFPLALMMVPTRIICQNMYRKLMGGNSDMLLHLRHGSQVEQRMTAAAKAIGSIQGYIDRFGNTLSVANSGSFSHHDLNVMLAMLFPYPKPGGTREVMTRERIDLMRKEFIDRYYMAPDNQKFLGKPLGFLNAYYDYLSHRSPNKVMPGSWNDRRLSGLVSGNDVKTKIIGKVMR